MQQESKFLFQVIYIMGVSGSGKTTIGRKLASRTGYLYYDADDFHTKENVAKMHAGIPLTDDDRWPWLQNIQGFVTEKIATNNIILVCSALKQVYREHLGRHIEDKCKWIFLQGDYQTILERLNQRAGHYMPPSLLQSQFDALEVPTNAIHVDIKLPAQAIVDTIVDKLKI